MFIEYFCSTQILIRKVLEASFQKGSPKLTGLRAQTLLDKTSEPNAPSVQK